MVYAITTWVIVAIVAYFMVYFHVNKNAVNMWLDLNMPKWYPQCQICRGVHFGVLFTILMQIALYLLYGYFFKI